MHQMCSIATKLYLFALIQQYPLNFQGFLLIFFPCFITGFASISKYAGANRWGCLLLKNMSRRPQTNIKRIREAAGLSQSMLSAEAGVSLRSIQMYEQRNKDINKAQALTIVKIARALGCDVEDLME